jgi:1,4-alpha-glucan branching enzyme
MLERAKRGGRAEVSFVLPAAVPEGMVSVVGDFNDWDPAAHILRPRADGKRAVKIALPAGYTFAFRYQSDDGLSYIEKDADGYDDRDSFVST